MCIQHWAVRYGKYKRSTNTTPSWLKMAKDLPMKGFHKTLTELGITSFCPWIFHFFPLAFSHLSPCYAAFSGFVGYGGSDSQPLSGHCFVPWTNGFQGLKSYSAVSVRDLSG